MNAFEVKDFSKIYGCKINNVYIKAKKLQIQIYNFFALIVNLVTKNLLTRFLPVINGLLNLSYNKASGNWSSSSSK